MAKRATKTPKQVLQPKVAAGAPPAPATAAAAIAALTPEQLAARAAELDQARATMKAAGERAAQAQAALDALPKDAADEQRQDALDLLAEAEGAVLSAEASFKALADLNEIPAGSHGDGHAVAAGPKGNHRTQGAGPNPGAVASASGTHTPASDDQGGAGNEAGPAGGDHAALDGGVLVVTTKRPQRWRAGRRFAKGEEVRVPVDELTEADFRAITEDPVLEARVEPG